MQLDSADGPVPLDRRRSDGGLLAELIAGPVIAAIGAASTFFVGPFVVAPASHGNAKWFVLTAAGGGALFAGGFYLYWSADRQLAWRRGTDTVPSPDLPSSPSAVRPARPAVAVAIDHGAALALTFRF